MTNILPLAITMMMGPQIMSAIIFVTVEKKPVRVSLAFLTGVVCAVTIGVLIAMGLASLLDNSVDLGDSSGQSTTGKIIELVLVGILALLILKNYLGRETAEPPKWMGTLQTAEPKRAFRTGLLVIFLMPSDVVIMLTTGLQLKSHDLAFREALPFIGLTVLIASIPLLAYVLFHKRAVVTMPKVRKWMNDNSWLVNIIALAFFIVIILA